MLGALRNLDLKLKIEEWLVEFDNEVDSCFSAGESQKGEVAFRAWHDRILRTLVSLDGGFDAFDRQRWKKHLSVGTSEITRAQFMRTCGRPAKAHLRRLRSEI